MIKYNGARSVRFSCAYLFRIKIDGKYFLVKDEQRRNHLQPVGGVYKYTDSSILDITHAVQCTRFGTGCDLDCDLRIIVPRRYVSKFWSWYRKEKGRETPDDLYREFREEVLDRIDSIDPKVFSTIHYKYCGECIEPSRMGESDMQIRIADVVELIPTPEQTKIFRELMAHESSVYTFATKEEIYNRGCTPDNPNPTIANHTFKILPEEEKKSLRRTRRSGKYYSCQGEPLQSAAIEESWVHIEKADMTKPFTFISYNSIHGRDVWDFCYHNRPPLENLWIDRKEVSENWMDDVERALNCPECNKAMLFINKDYLLRSYACYHEASLIVDHKIPHVVVLVDIDLRYLRELIKDWTFSDIADKKKLRVFKNLLHYNDDSGHIECSTFSLKEGAPDRLFQAWANL